VQKAVSDGLVRRPYVRVFLINPMAVFPGMAGTV
jgi:hypothetical protein